MLPLTSPDEFNVVLVLGFSFPLHHSSYYCRVYGFCRDEIFCLSTCEGQNHTRADDRLGRHSTVVASRHPPEKCPGRQ